MIRRNYYSIRTGKVLPDQDDFGVLKKMFLIVFKTLNSDGYFQKYFGVDCTDGYIPGVLGDDVQSVIYINLRKDKLYPIHEYLDFYSEDDFFDMIEFLHDHCSKGLNGSFHDWNGCGYHYEEFNDLEGQRYFRELLNPILREYKTGYEISSDGEILFLSDHGLSNLFKADIPSDDVKNVKGRIDSAVLKFRKIRSTLDDRRESIRELADVLEYLRPTIKGKLDSKDENDLFNIANNFGVRHHNQQQKTNYDKSIWYSWIFYYYLATLHAVLRIKEK